MLIKGIIVGDKKNPFSSKSKEIIFTDQFMLSDQIKLKIKLKA
jgi:hypothetical protein